MIYLNFVVTFHDLISDIIPDIIILLKDNKIKLQLRSASIIETLAEHGMWTHKILYSRDLGLLPVSQIL